LALADLEARDALPGLASHRLLAGNDRQFALGALDAALVTGDDGLADAHADDDLLDPGDRQVVLVTELLLELREHVLLVVQRQPRLGHVLVRVLIDAELFLALLFLLRHVWSPSG